MKVVIPIDGNPIKYWEDGSVKTIEKYIWVETDKPIISFVVFAPINFNFGLIDENIPPITTLFKKADYKKIIGLDLNGANRYELINEKELLG